MRLEHARGGSAGGGGHRGVEQVGGRDGGGGRRGGAEPAAHPEVDEHHADRAERHGHAPAGDETGDERFEHGRAWYRRHRAYASAIRQMLR